MKDLGFKIKDLRSEMYLRIGLRGIGFKIKKIRFLSPISYFLLLISYLVILVPSVHAQQLASFPRQYFRVSPIISELKITPGKQTSFNLTVENLSESPLGIHAETSSLLEADSEEIGTDIPSLTKWTKLSENDFIIDAKEQRTIKITISPPKGIQEGGFYEVIYLTPFVSGQIQTQKPVVLSRIGALVFATNGELDYKNLKQKVNINRFGPSAFFLSDRVFKLDLAVENKYFTHFSAKPTMSIDRIFGNSEKVNIEEKKILPGRVRSWEVTGEVKGFGIYKANLLLSIGGGEQLTANTWFVLLPSKTITAGVFILAIILFVKFRKDRFKKALKILVGKS